MAVSRRCRCCDFEFVTVEQKDEHETYMQAHGLFDQQRRETEAINGTGCEYGCPYGSDEHEARLWEWERTGKW